MVKLPEFAAQAAIGGLAAILLFWGLADKDLWQDEAATAVLAVRLLKFGRPLAYDGVNLVTTDMLTDADAVSRQTADPRAAVAYHLRRGEFKPDTAWKWQPWGLFAVAALSFKALGQTTLAARLPFALAGWAAVALLFRLVRRFSASFSMAALAALFLVCNPYWILHARQCRYYALASLFLVLTLLAYLRWQRGGRWGATAFVAAAWCWFQVDYGTVWPVLAVLFLDALLARTRPLRNTAAVAAALAAALAPFLYYYELWGRGSPLAGWPERFQDNVFNLNEYVAPAVVLLAATALLVRRWKSLAGPERHVVALSLGILLVLALWIPTVAYPYLRYSIIAAPVGGLLAAWTLVRVCGNRTAWIAWPAAALLILTPWASLPLHAVVPPPDWYPPNDWFRTEFADLRTSVFGHQPDPNRLVIDWLRKNAAPSDEILINYEDLPLMFYLPNPIRGGISAFRVEDDARTPPRFVILRRSVDFVHWPLFNREVQRYQWAPVPVQAPDLLWGNNPDPMGQYENPWKEPNLYIARRIGP